VSTDVQPAADEKERRLKAQPLGSRARVDALIMYLDSLESINEAERSRWRQVAQRGSSEELAELERTLLRLIAGLTDVSDTPPVRPPDAAVFHLSRPVRSGIVTALAVQQLEESQPISGRDREILVFEREWWKFAGAKEQAIRDKFQMTATGYYKQLNALIDNPAAMDFDPKLVSRLRRLRAIRNRTRSAPRLGIDLTIDD
jgi:hypothetical protein